MAKQYGFVGLERISKQVAGAALAAGIAGASAGYEDLKDDLKGAAPVGRGSTSTRGRVTPGGRTKASIGMAYPRVDVLDVSQFGGIADVKAEIVMAPQGIYHNDGVGAQRISPKQRSAMVFLSGNKWYAVGPGLRGGFTTNKNPGFARVGLGTQFVQRGGVNKGAQPGSGWIDKITYRPSIVAAQAAFARIARKKTPVPSSIDIPSRAFKYSAFPGAWGSGYRASNDQKLRNRWRSAANRAGQVWKNQVAKAISRIR